MKYTKFEIARVIGARALQISMDAPLLVKLSTEDLERIKYNPVEIAKMEFEAGVLPIKVERIMPKQRVLEQEKKQPEVKSIERDIDLGLSDKTI